jgi:hypothetical protein
MSNKDKYKDALRVVLHVKPHQRKMAQIILESMITNLDEWERGDSPLLYKFGDHVTPHAAIFIDRDFEMRTRIWDSLEN